MQRPLAWLISTLRAGKTKKAYSLIGGKSPILDITSAQAHALQKALDGADGPYKVYVGMRYWQPFIEDAVGQMRTDGIKRLIALSLYPHYSVATTGSSESRLREALRGLPIEVSFISSFYDHPLYIEALAGTIRKALERFENAPVALFSAHSLPVRFIEEGDPYVEHIMATIRAVTEKINMSWRLGYQSKSGPVRWLEPSTEEVLRELAEESSGGAVVMVPISFVSDHIETLYEIDILYRGIAEGLGLRLERAEALNTHPLFIDALKDMVLKKAEEAGWTRQIKEHGPLR